MSNRRISVVGLGYVGLPAAVAFGKQNKCIGFDINQQRIDELISGYDRTEETSAEDLANTNV
ncbi:MAG: nucleotide sugar dehydrogenase, partial [Burkholderiales bacterium]|nr:nucleotide sugar dehydrogenase [Burkholderiales bacterium]